MLEIVSSDDVSIYIKDDAIGRHFHIDGTYTFEENGRVRGTYRWSLDDTGHLLWREQTINGWCMMISELERNNSWSNIVKGWLADIELLHG